MTETVMRQEKNRLKAKDLIVAGAFAALYIVVALVVVSAAGIVPVTYLMAPLFVGVVCGPIYMLYTMRVPKPGAILLLSVLLALIYSGFVWHSALWVLLCGLIAEAICFAGRYRSKTLATASWCAFACTTVGPFTMIFFAKNTFVEMCMEYYGQEYAETIDRLTPSWILLVLAGLALVGGLLGGLLGRRILGKHFEKAGMV